VMIVEYTHGEYCNVRLVLGICNSPIGIATREHTLRYAGHRHPGANVFRRLEKRLRDTGIITLTAYVNACRPWTVMSPAN
jgi:hypothetical protein